MDVTGDLYGTTNTDGAYGRGTAFEVSLSGTETVLHSFGSGTDGTYPYAGLIRDAAGNLYGTTQLGGNGSGTVFELIPTGPPKVKLSRELLVFRTKHGTTSPPQTVTVTNTGTGTLNFTSITLGGLNPDQFTETNTCGSVLAPGANCTISVVYHPEHVELSAATVNINDNAAPPTQYVFLAGVGY